MNPTTAMVNIIDVSVILKKFNDHCTSLLNGLAVHRAQNQVIFMTNKLVGKRAQARNVTSSLRELSNERNPRIW